MLISKFRSWRVVQLRKYSPNSRCRPSSCLLDDLAMFLVNSSPISSWSNEWNVRHFCSHYQKNNSTWLCLAKQVLLFLGIKVRNFCQDVLYPLGPLIRGFFLYLIGNSVGQWDICKKMADNDASPNLSWRKSVDLSKPCDCSYSACQIEALFVRRKYASYPSYRSANQFFLLFLMTKLGVPFTWETKRWLG